MSPRGQILVPLLGVSELLKRQERIAGCRQVGFFFFGWGGAVIRDSSLIKVLLCLGFPYGSAGKESACNAGDLRLIPGLGRSPGEGKGYPLQYSCLENPRFAKSRT